MRRIKRYCGYLKRVKNDCLFVFGIRTIEPVKSVIVIVSDVRLNK